MLLQLAPDVVDLRLNYLPPADWAFLALGNGGGNYIAILISFLRSFHKPVAMNTDQVETVEAAVDSDQVNSVSEFLSKVLLLLLAEMLQADCTSTFDGVVVGGNYLPHFLV